MRTLKYDEYTTSVLRPRHPVVSYLDILGGVIASYALLLVEHVEVAVYLGCILVLYIASWAHHWFVHTDFRRALDHSMIYIVIGATVLPYWQFHLREERSWALLFLLFVVCGGAASKFKFFGSRKMSTGLYTTTGMVSVWVMWDIDQYIGVVYASLFWLGVALYGLQLLIYRKKLFDFVPKLFGYREVQHVVLTAATTLHIVLAIVLIG